MKLVYDIIINNDQDLEFLNGDFRIDESTGQSINFLMIANRGDFVEFPLVGADVTRLLSEEANPNEVKADIQNELEKDRLKVQDISIVDSVINVIAEYK